MTLSLAARFNPSAKVPIAWSSRISRFAELGDINEFHLSLMLFLGAEVYEGPGQFRINQMT
jgi:hypothetical protein